MSYSHSFRGSVLRIAKSIYSSLLLAGTVAAPLVAQDTTGLQVTVHVSDSVAHVVDRIPLDRARFAIVSERGDAALLLMDTTIVAQMTDRGLARMNSHDAADSTKSPAGKIFARMALAAVGSLFDHGIAYHLRDLRDAKYDDGRLQLIGANGKEIFRDTEINNTSLMESFRPADARAFAAQALAAKRRMR